MDSTDSRPSGSVCVDSRLLVSLCVCIVCVVWFLVVLQVFYCAILVPCVFVRDSGSSSVCCAGVLFIVTCLDLGFVKGLQKICILD